MAVLTSEMLPRESNYRAKDRSIFKDKLILLTGSIQQLRKNVKEQGERFQRELALLKRSQREQELFKEDDIPEEEHSISEQEKEEQAFAWYQNQASAIEVTLAAEPPDNQWAEEIQTRFEAVLETSDTDVEIQSLRCGSTMCKVSAEVTGGDASSGPNIDHLVYGDMQWDGQFFSKYDADTGEITLFLMRPGVDMPTFEFASKV